jgi:hypothetical protein
MLPALDNRGFLPEGVHLATLAEIRVSFSTNAIRAHLLSEFHRFLGDHLIGLAAGLDLYICGSFLSDKAMPGDIDCTIEIPLAAVAQRAAFMHLLNDGRTSTQKGWIWDQYRVDIWPTITGVPGASNFIAFFQYVGLKSATMKNLNQTDKRGIVKVDQWIHG